MSDWILIGIVAYVAFSLGIIVGCMIMTKDDNEDKLSDNQDLVEKKLPESVVTEKPKESVSHELGK